MVQEIIRTGFVGKTEALFIHFQMRLGTWIKLINRTWESKISLTIIDIARFNARSDQTAVKNHRRICRIHLSTGPNAGTNSHSGIRTIVTVRCNALINNRRQRFDHLRIARITAGCQNYILRIDFYISSAGIREDRAGNFSVSILYQPNQGHGIIDFIA